MVNTGTKRRCVARIPYASEARIVELSLQNPEFGARRLLPLLFQENIAVSESSVYRILKRHGLQNRERRLSKIKELEAFDSRRLKRAARPPSAEEKPLWVPPADVENAPLRRGLPASRGLATKKVLMAWALTFINVLLLAVLSYLGFQWVQHIRSAARELQIAATAVPGSINFAGGAMKVSAAAPLGDYRMVWERNLFDTGSATDSGAAKKIPIAKIALVQKDLGLELVGTVVAENPGLSLAVIDNRRVRKQAAYREGDSVGEARVKKILRNQVVIATAGGDALLTIEIKASGGDIIPHSNTQKQPTGSMSSLKASSGKQPGSNPWAFNIQFEELAASLADAGQLLHKATIFPYMKGNQLAGFKITNIEPLSVLSKMGLQNGDVIRGVNGEAVTGPEQAADFFRTVAEGGVVEIKIKRRRRTRYISLNVQ